MSHARDKCPDGPDRDRSSTRVGALRSGSFEPEDLTSALRAALPSFEPLDAELSIDGRALADLAGVSEGRIVLVRESRGRGAAEALEALDLVRRARRLAPWLERHLDRACDGAPLVVLVARRFRRGFRERIALARPDALRLFELHECRGVRGTTLAALWLGADAGGDPPVDSSTCAPRRPESEAAAPGAVTARTLAGSRSGAADADPSQMESALELPAELDSIAARLDPADRGVGRDLARRLDRVDPELEREHLPDAVRWSWRGQPLCTLEVREGRLEGRLLDADVGHRLATPFAADTFLDWVLAAHLELLEAELGGDADAPFGPVGSGGDFAAELDDELDDDDAGLGFEELRPARPEPLLTPEEIEAFRE